MIRNGPSHYATEMSCQPPLLRHLITHRQKLLKTATRITGCPSKAEDVLQDAFFRLDSNTSKIDSLKAQISYVFCVVRNLAIDHYRKQTSEGRFIQPEQENDQHDCHGCTPESHCVHRETLELIDNALAQLPERTRYAFEMYRLHGIPQKQIAAELGVSPTLVNFMVRDALVHCSRFAKRSQKSDLSSSSSITHKK